MNSKTAIKQLHEIAKLGKDMRLAAEWEKDWHILIATLLSARTRDEVTIVVAGNLFKKYSTLEKLSKAKISDLQKILKPVNFYKNKSKNILKCAKAIVKEHKGKVPRDFDRLVKLPGVGRKTANVFLAVDGKPAIGVDTHVNYISNKLGWTSSLKQEQVEKSLKKLFPKKYWRKINYILVCFGRTYTSRKEKNEILKQIKKIK